MRTVIIRAMAMGALAMLTFTNDAGSQTASPPILNVLEVQTLVASGGPDDSARLSAHFNALADRYEAEAQRHVAMAQTFVGNPNRSPATGARGHCRRLATLNAESARTARELAAYHRRLATGAPTTFLPRDSTRFHGGAGATAPTPRELRARAAKASTPADHRALEEYFRIVAKRFAAAAQEHATVAQSYRGTRLAQTAAHCDHLAAMDRDSAEEAIAAAAMHKQLAGIQR